jgi:hypothetical protein
MTPEQEEARKRRAVTAARRLLSGEVGLAYGAKRVRDALLHLGRDVPKSFPTFDEFLGAIPMAIPLGELRLLCQEGLLLSSDQILATVEGKYRQSLLRECLSVVQAYEPAGK